VHKALDFRSITKKNVDWNNLKGPMEIVLAAEEHSLGWMASSSMFDAGSFWWVNLFPQLEIVEHAETKVRYLVGYVVEDVAVMLFRTPDAVDGLIPWPKTLADWPPSAIEWKTVEALGSLQLWSVVITTHVAPVGLQLAYKQKQRTSSIKLSPPKPAIALKVEGPVVPMLEWHRDRGCPGLKKGTLNCLLTALNASPALMTLAEDALGDVTEEEALALAVMAQLKAKLSKEHVSSVLRRRRKEAEQVDHLKGLLNGDVLPELMHMSDQQKTRDFIRAEEKKDLDRIEASRGVETLVDKAYENVPAVRAMSTGAGRGGGGGGDRWTARVRPGTAMERRIRALSPGPAEIVISKQQGLLTLAYDKRRIRSYSWTLRGKDNCLRMTLTKAWQVHAQETGRECPAHIVREIQSVRADL
jgi:hypothetical protein